MILPKCQEKEKKRVKFSGKTMIKCEQIAEATTIPMSLGKYLALVTSKHLFHS